MNARLYTLLLIGALAMSGCASNGADFNSDKVADIHKGTTTEPQLISMFGEPNQRSIDSDARTRLVWFYAHAHVTASSFFFHGGGAKTQKTLTVTLKDGLVTDYSLAEGGSGARVGS